MKLSDEVKLPVRVLKNPLKYSNFNDEQFILNKDFKLLRLRFNETSDLLQHKNLPHATYLVYKQKRYQRRDKFVPKYGFEFPITIAKPRQDFQYLESVEGTQDTVSAQKLDTSINPKTTKQKKPVNIYLQGNQLIVDNLESVLPNYRAIRKNKNNSESMHNNLNRRLLRTKRTLVLPAHVNITIITNSYDVIHS